MTQTTEEAGKTTNNDEDKNSFVTLLGLEKAMDEANKLASEIEQQLLSFDESLQSKLSPILNSYIHRHR